MKKQTGKLENVYMHQLCKPLKVALCMPDFIIGGVESVFCRTLDELAKVNNLEIIIITRARIKMAFYEKLIKKHENIKIYYYYPLQHIFDSIKPVTDNIPVIKNIRRCIFGLYKRYRRFLIKKRNQFKNVDVFVDYHGCSFYKEFKAFPDKRKIVWIHANIDYMHKNSMDGMLPIYDKIIGLTDDFIRDFRNEYPEQADKVVCIYNPIDKNKILELEKIAPRPNSKHYFVQVSRLETKQKDIKTLMFAFDKFYELNNEPDVDLFIVGTGSQERYLKRLSKKLLSCKKIHFVGALTNPYGYMSGAMAHILSTYYEGLPTVLVEAQVCGTLNISANCKYGPREILENGKSGLLFPVGDSNRLAQLMTDVYLGKVNKKKMIEEGYRGLNRFAPDVITNQILEVLQND